jgi:UDP-N-acetylglucosamine 2-epimerase (non-hydrolysing)
VRLAVFVGTRPNFVKAAAVVSAFRRRGIEVPIIHSGQHADATLSGSFFAQLQLPEPKHHLGVGPRPRGAQLGEIVERFSVLLPSLQLDELIVVGDVTSTAAGALAADACDVPVAHVEAGLRSFDWTMPEERYRRIVDAIAQKLLVTEPSGVANLRAEGREEAQIHFVGNVMIDTLLRFRARAEEARPWERYGCERGRYIVATLHRPHNVDEPVALAESVAALEVAARRYPVLFAAHPRTRTKIKDFRLEIPSGIRVLPPLGYLEFIGLVTGALAVLTDSGGAQEETTVLDVPCLTMRETTERPITCELGTSRLVGRSVEEIEHALDEIEDGTYPHTQPIPLWDGGAADRIAAVFLDGKPGTEIGGVEAEG